MKKVLIFGYNGFVGPYLANEFKNHNYFVIGSDISDCVQHQDVEFFKCDITDFESINKVISDTKPNIIINLAAISSVGQSWKNPQLTMKINVNGALNILEAAKGLEDKPKILFVGSSEEYKPSDKPISETNEIDSNNPYGISKSTQERFASIYRERYGMKVYCVRPFNHTGFGQRDNFVLPSFCKQVAEIEKSGKPGEIFVGNLEVYRDFSDVRDVVRAYRLVVESDEDSIIYNIGSGNAYSLKDLLAFIISLSKQKIEVVVDQEKYRPVDTPYICCDYTLINKNLGWKPDYDIKDTLKAMFDEYIK